LATLIRRERPIERAAKERKRDAAAGSMIHRRSFLTGLATTLLAGTAAKPMQAMLPMRPMHLPEMLPYGYDRSPAMYALGDMVKWNGITYRAYNSSVQHLL
jgi:hypothetical protein